MAAHRYWRVLATTTSGFGWGFSEIDVWEGEFGPSALARPGWTIIGSPVSVGSLNNLVDGNVGGPNAYSAVTAPPWVGFDFGVGQSVEIHAVRLWAMNAGNSYLLGGLVQSSDDGETWADEWPLSFTSADYLRGSTNFPAVSLRPAAPPNPASTPLSFRFGTAIEYWLDPGGDVFSDDGSTPIEDGQGVYRVDNRGTYPGAEDFVQREVARRPVWREGGTLGFPYLDCDGTQRFEDVSWAQPSGVTNLRPYAAYAVVENPSREALAPFWGSTAGNGGKAGFYLQPGNPGAEIRIAKDANNSGDYTPASRLICAAALSYAATWASVDLDVNFRSRFSNLVSTAISRANVLWNDGITGDPHYKGRLYSLILTDGANFVDAEIIRAWLWGKYVVGFEGGGGAEITPGSGAVVWAGHAPAFEAPDVLSFGPAAVAWTGAPPLLTAEVTVEIGRGDFGFIGRRHAFAEQSLLRMGSGSMAWRGHAPLIFDAADAGVLATQLAVIGVADSGPPESRASQMAVLAVAEPPPPPVRASQAAVMAIGEVVPDLQASQIAIIAVADGEPCVTQRCQCWTLWRRDGRVFRFTSHDQDLWWRGGWYRACDSLDPSASENASSLGSVGNIELAGIISSDEISEADLYGGLFDDAYVTVDLVAWGARPEAPRRLASGWTGALSHGESGFTMEVLGGGARLGQQALVQMVTPGCRWVFGDARCGVDREALATTGVIARASTRAAYVAELSGDGAGAQWENGTLRFTAGANAGQELEVKSVDFETGEVVLWPSSAHLAAPGDAFTLLPGCDKARDGGCSLYANVVNHGGFPDIPGSDDIMKTPDAKY